MYSVWRQRVVLVLISQQLPVRLNGIPSPEVEPPTLEWPEDLPQHLKAKGQSSVRNDMKLVVQEKGKEDQM